MTAPLISDLEAERAVLGGLLADPRRIAEAATIVRADDFSTDRTRVVFEALLELDQTGRAVDPLSVADVLKAKARLDVAGGMAAVLDLDTAAPSAANVFEYARIVATVGARRRICEAANEIARKAMRGHDPCEIAAHATAQIADAVPPKSRGGLEAAPVVLDRALAMLEAAQKAGGGVTGATTGFGDYDRMTTGMHPGELLVLAARPGVGKTALAVNVATHLAVSLAQTVAVFSLEMPAEQLMQRVLSAIAAVPLSQIRGGKLSDYDMRKINDAAMRVHGSALHIDETPAATLFDMRGRLRALANKGATPALVVVDYLQLMGGTSRFNSREQEVAANSRGLKQLAKEFAVPVLALAQLSRKAEERSGPPKLSDLRESGAIEQDADVVMFLHRDDDGEAELGMTPIDLLVAKQRNGPIGRVGLMLKGDLTKFEPRYCE